jgi:ribonuclease HI
VSAQSELAEMGKRRANYIAVATGRTPGVYKSWEKAQPSVSGYSGARYKGFSTQAAACEFVAEPPTVYQAAVANAAARNSFMVANSGAALHSNRLGGWRSSLGTASGRGK